MSGDPEFMTVAQTALRLGLSKYQVRAEKARGTLPHHIVGQRFVRFTEDDVAEYKRRTQAATAPGSLQRSQKKRKTA